MFGTSTAWWDVSTALHITGKTCLQLTVGRSVGGAQTLFSNYLVEEGVSVSPIYLATEKITIRPSWSFNRRTYEGSPFGGSDELRQNTRATSVAADWAILRAVDLSASVTSSSRTSNNSAFQYRDRSVFVGGRFKF